MRDIHIEHAAIRGKLNRKVSGLEGRFLVCCLSGRLRCSHMQGVLARAPLCSLRLYRLRIRRCLAIRLLRYVCAVLRLGILSVCCLVILGKAAAVLRDELQTAISCTHHVDIVEHIYRAHNESQHYRYGAHGYQHKLSAQALLHQAAPSITSSEYP